MHEKIIKICTIKGWNRKAATTSQPFSNTIKVPSGSLDLWTTFEVNKWQSSLFSSFFNTLEVPQTQTRILLIHNKLNQLQKVCI